MAVLDIRQRSGYLFLAVMLGHVILISAQVTSRSGVPVLEAVTFGLVAEAQRAVSTGVANLRHQLEAVQVQYQERRALADRASALEGLLALRDRSNLQTAAAVIIAAS